MIIAAAGGSEIDGMRVLPLLAVVLAVSAVTGTARASQLIDRNAHDVRLAVNAKGEALLTYHDSGGIKHVLAWGAVNAIAPTRDRGQVEFKLDYSGGWGNTGAPTGRRSARRAAGTTGRRSPGS